MVLFKQSHGPPAVWKWYDHGCDFTVSAHACSPLSPPLPPSVPSPPSPPPVMPGAAAAYVVSDTMTNPDPGPQMFDNAKAHCAGLGLQLAVAATSSAHTALVDAIVAAEGTGSHGGMYWIGLSGSVSAGWVWGDGTALTLDHWPTGRPGGAHACVMLYKRSTPPIWAYNNWDCSAPLAFVCSPPPPSPPPSLPSPPTAPPPSAPPDEGDEDSMPMATVLIICAAGVALAVTAVGVGLSAIKVTRVKPARALPSTMSSRSVGSPAARSEVQLTSSDHAGFSSAPHTC